MMVEQAAAERECLCISGSNKVTIWVPKGKNKSKQVKTWLLERKSELSIFCKTGCSSGEPAKAPRIERLRWALGLTAKSAEVAESIKYKNDQIKQKQKLLLCHIPQ